MRQQLSFRPHFRRGNAPLVTKIVVAQVVISGDMRIYRNRLEREAWRRSRLIVFFLAPQWSKIRNIEKAWRLLRWWLRLRNGGDHGAAGCR